MTGATVTTKFQCRLTIAGNLFGRIASWIKRSQRENRDLAATVCVGVDTEGFCSETGLWISTIEEDKCKAFAIATLQERDIHKRLSDTFRS